MFFKLLFFALFLGLFHKDIVAVDRRGLSVEFLIIDAKFDGKQLKVLEFGSGLRSGFDGYDRFFGHGAVWDKFWNYLSKFGRPMWYLRTPKMNTAAGKSWYNFLSGDDFVRMGGKFAVSPEEVVQNILPFYQGLDNVYRDYNGIFCVNISKHRPDSEQINREMREKFPGAVFINNISDNFVFNKSKTDRLFRDEYSRDFRPRSIVCSKLYRTSLAKKISETLKANLFVIKPLNAQYGKGVIFVRKEDLDGVLREILLNIKSSHSCDMTNVHRCLTRIPLDEAISYWLTDTNSRFIIEEYVASKLVDSEGKKYDATLRAIFTMHCENHKITVTPLGAYWKLPTHAIDEVGSLNEIHQSYQYDRENISEKVDESDFDIISEQLKDVMTRIYVKMITQAKHS